MSSFKYENLDLDRGSDGGKKRSRVTIALTTLVVLVAGVALVATLARNHIPDPTEGPGTFSRKTRLVQALHEHFPILRAAADSTEIGPDFEGDLKIPASQIREAYGPNAGYLLEEPDKRVVGQDGLTSIAARKWTNGIVYYILNGNLQTGHRQNYEWAMRHIECHVPGLYFRERKSQEANYIEIHRDTSARGYCYSTGIGMMGGKQRIAGDSCGRGTAVHELLHAIGFWHEQSRPDRDQWINIHWNNINSRWHSQFNKRLSIDSRKFPYDYGSVMQYPDWAFANSGTKSITSKNGEGLGQRNGMSGNDVQQCRAMYQPTNVYFIKSVHSGKVMDVSGWSLSNGGNIHQWTKHGGRNQQWIIPALNQWVSVKNVHSGGYMDISGWSRSNGGNLHQWSYHGGNNQQFRFVPLGSGMYKIESRHSGRVLDVSGWSGGNGGNIHQWQYHGGNNQKWRLETVNPPTNIYFIVSKHSGKVMDVSGWSGSNGGNIHQWSLHGGRNQQWVIPRLDGHAVVVRNVHSGKYMDISGYSRNNGGNLHQWSHHGQTNQQFQFQHQGGDWYRIRSVHSGKYLDVSGWSLNNGANIHQWGWHGGANQLWKVIRIPAF